MSLEYNSPSQGSDYENLYDDKSPSPSSVSGDSLNHSPLPPMDYYSDEEEMHEEYGKTIKAAKNDLERPRDEDEEIKITQDQYFCTSICR